MQKDDDGEKPKNFYYILEKMMNIKTVQIKSEMLFSKTDGNKPSDHYELQDKMQTGTFALICSVKNNFRECIHSMKKKTLKQQWRFLR